MKKGFTIVELISVIAIIGLLAILIIPNVKNMIENSEEKSYKVQIKSIKDSAESFANEYFSIFPKENDASVTVDLKLLKDLSFIDYKIKNPKNSKYFSDDSLISLTRKENTYKATIYLRDSNKISNLTKYRKHIVMLKEKNLYSGSNYKSASNIVVSNFDELIYPNTKYSVAVINEPSTINKGFQTITYTVTIIEDTQTYIYTVKRDEKP